MTSACPRGGDDGIARLPCLLGLFPGREGSPCGDRQPRHCSQGLVPLHPRGFARVAIALAQRPGAVEMAHGEELPQGRAGSKRLLSFCCSNAFSVFFRFPVSDLFQVAIEYKCSSKHKCNFFPFHPISLPQKHAPPNHLKQDANDIKKLLPIFADLLKKNPQTHILTLPISKQ